MMEGKKVLFFYMKYSSFVRQDEEILKENFRVRSHGFGSTKGWRMLISQISRLMWLIFNSWGAKTYYIWFADFHAWLPVQMARITGARVIVVIGGYDAEADAELKYGALLGGIRRKVTLSVIKRANTLLCVSNYTRTRLMENSDLDIEGKSMVVHNGVSEDSFKRVPSSESGYFLFVGFIEGPQSYFVKGVDLIVELAISLPDKEFIIIGDGGYIKNKLEGRIPDNLKILGPNQRTNLNERYSGALALLVPSRRESFGMVAVEAMLCGCPIITWKGIGTGELQIPGEVLLDSREILLWKKFLQQFHSRTMAESDQIRKFAVEKFSLDARKRKVLKLLSPEKN